MLETCRNQLTFSCVNKGFDLLNQLLDGLGSPFEFFLV